MKIVETENFKKAHVHLQTQPGDLFSPERNVDNAVDFFKSKKKQKKSKKNQRRVNKEDKSNSLETIPETML